MPLTTEELIKTIESNQSTIMFEFQGHISEGIIRNSTGQLARFRQAFDKYPPVYWNKYGMAYDKRNLYELLTKHRIVFIAESMYATEIVKEIAAPKCTNIFTTAIDGIHIYVH